MKDELRVDAVLREASNRTGLNDFGGTDFLEPLGILLRALEEEGRLSVAGRTSLLERVIGLLVNRLRLQYWLVLHPEILEEQIDAPLVIVGFPRTGTTMLQRLMASDPRATALMWWEARNPAPFLEWAPALAARTQDQRIADAKEQTRVMLAGNPDLAAVHPFDPEAPDEDAMLLEHAFRSSAPAALCNVPTYLEWHLNQDNRAAYQYLKQALQCIQWQKRLRGERVGRWVLKAPEHMSHLPLLFEQFPKATVIQPHRDPVEIYPSLASMVFELRRLASDRIDPSDAAAYVRTSSAHRIRRLLEARRVLPAERFIDIWFKDVMSDPIAQVGYIYERLGIDFTPEAKRCMNAWLEANRRDQRPTHEYTLEQFGFVAGEIRQELTEYRETYVLPCSPHAC